MSADNALTGVPKPRGVDEPRFLLAVRDMLEAAGFDIDEVHLAATAEHVLELWQHRLIDGYEVDTAATLGDGFADAGSDLVVVRDIAVHGVCPHHLVPWRGVAHVAYVPGGRLHGFGRIARLVDGLSHRLTYQEWFTRDVANALVQHGMAQGAACVVSSVQLCLILGENRRGEERVVTTAFAGLFEKDHQRQAELLRSLGLS